MEISEWCITSQLEPTPKEGVSGKILTYLKVMGFSQAFILLTPFTHSLVIWYDLEVEQEWITGFFCSRATDATYIKPLPLAKDGA